MLDQEHELDALWDAIGHLAEYEADRMTAADLSRLCAEVDRAAHALGIVVGRLAADAEAVGDAEDGAAS